MNDKKTQRIKFITEFVNINADWWSNPRNSMYGRKAEVTEFLLTSVQNGRFADDFGVPEYIHAETKLKEFAVSQDMDWLFK